MASILAKKFSSNVHVVDSESRNLLHISAISSSGRDILPFIHSEFGLNSKDVDNYGRTPLHYVASSDKVDEEFKLHEYLVRVSNCPVNQRDNVIILQKYFETNVLFRMGRQHFTSLLRVTE
jgi:hypothetical protein